MPPNASPTCGVLALQGDVREHVRALGRLGAEIRLVRFPRDLGDLDGLVIPGGESTTLQHLLEDVAMWGPLREAIEAGLPTLATCAGTILLAERIVDGRDGQRSLGLLDIAVRRNAYGRQVASFESPVELEGADGEFPGVFIRAPRIEDTGSTHVIAKHGDEPVGVRQGSIIGLCFHPELTDDLRLHRLLISGDSQA